MVHDFADELAPITPDGLDALGVQLARLIRVLPFQARVPLLVHEQIRLVHFLELHFDRRPELAAHSLSSRFAKSESLRHAAAGAQGDHHRVRVAVDDPCIPLITARHAELGLHDVFCRLDHATAVSGDRSCYRLAGQGSHVHASEAINGVRRHLQGELAAIENGPQVRVGRGFELLLRLRAGGEQLLQNQRHQTAPHAPRDEAMAQVGHGLHAWAVGLVRRRGGPGLQQRAVAQVVPLHDGRVQ
mmetsp:Transcript_60277/g.184127  ORF Transcript_60277/g.184127 Transcript_60277/m.184127 type:complete len:244 (+) Transcript_60277:477-1208(+)